MRKVIPIIAFALLISIVLAAVIAYPVIHYFFIPNNNVVPAFDETRLNLVVEGEQVISKGQPKIVDEEILLPMDVIKKYFDSNIYWDEKLQKVTVTTKDRVIRMKTDSLNALVNNKPVTLKIPVSIDNGTVYVPIEFLSDFYRIDIAYLKEGNVIVIDRRDSVRQLAEPIGKDAVVRKGRSIHYPVIKKLGMDAGKTGDNTMRIFEEYDRWYKVRTSDGAVGYVEKRFVVVRKIFVNELPVEEDSTSAWKPEKGKISLVWEMMYGKRPDLSRINKMEGLDVISPTWFQVAGEDGTLINRADAKYVEWAHKNGYKVWALLSNDFGDPAMTERLLRNTDARDNIIKQILVFSSLYKLDGINIDFENINKSDRDSLTQFVREITPFLKEQGLTVSMDVSIPDGSDNWSLCYDRKALGGIVDYIMLMAYDQHWSTSPEAGSVAQITWVENNLKKVLELVPREKLLLGLPFYTRLWKEEKDSDGNVRVTSPNPLSMEEATKMISENNAAVVWDDESGQFYAEFKKDGAVYKIWVEDENSINLKSSLVQKYRLAGAAAWRRSDEVQAIWTVLNNNLKLLDNYRDWKSQNTGKKVYANHS